MNNIIKTFATMSVLLLSSHSLNAQIHFGSQSNNNSNTVNESNVSSAIGTNNTSTGQCSFAGGNNSTASGLNSFAFGSQASSTGANSVAIGFCATSSGVISYSFGKHVASNQNSAMTIGFGQKDHPLVNNVSGSIAMGVGSNIPTFLITDSHFVGKTGKVAIGNCTVPQSKLHIKADNDEDADITLEPCQDKDAKIMFRDTESFIKVEKSGKMTIAVPNKPIFFNASKYYINSNNTYIENKEDIDFNVKAPKNINVDAEQLRITGKVGINVENYQDNYALAVNGGIITTEVYIAEADNWPDHVFADDYKLMGLHELENFIRANRHLPEVPSEEEVLENGYDMGEMQGLLLKKIEELTLYTIQLQEQIERQQKEIDELKAK